MIVSGSFIILNSWKNARMQNFCMSITKFSYLVLFDNTRWFGATLCPFMLKELLYGVSGWQQIFSFVLRQGSILERKAVRQYEI